MRDQKSPASDLQSAWGPELLTSMSSSWDDLFQRADEPFLSSSSTWCRVSWETVAEPRGRQLFSLTQSRGGRLTLVWPFVVYRRLGVKIAQPLTSEASEYSSVLVDPGVANEALVLECLKRVAEETKCDVIRLQYTPCDSLLHAAAIQLKRPSHLWHIPAPWIASGDVSEWTSYESRFTRQQRSERRRRRRRLEELGPVLFGLEPLDTRGEAIDWVLQQKATWLERKQLSNDWLHTSEYRAFLQALAREPTAYGELAVFSLRARGQMIAAEVGAVTESRCEMLIATYDPAYATYAPGELLREESIRWAAGRDLSYDFRVGAESYKERWASRIRDVVSMEYAMSPRGRLFIAAKRTFLAVPASGQGRLKAGLRQVESFLSGARRKR